MLITSSYSDTFLKCYVGDENRGKKCENSLQIFLVAHSLELFPLAIFSILSQCLGMDDIE